MFIRTERLFLRPGWPEDLDDVFEALREGAIWRTVSAPALPETREGLREYLGRSRDPRLPHFFMYLRGSGGAKLVGSIGFAPYPEGVEVAYWIASAYRGRGYALEALRAVVEQARALGHRRLVAKHLVDNDDSIRVLEAAGFRDDGGEPLLFSTNRNDDALAHLYVVDLERGAAPRMEPHRAVLSA